MAAASEVKKGSRPPWVGLGAAVWVQFAAGSAYTFPLYSPSLKSVLGYGQQQVTLLGVANDVGENFGLLPALFSISHVSPRNFLLAGSLACFLGYGTLWLALTGTLSLPYWLIWIALCVATNSSTWFGTAVLLTNMKNFPISRGTVAGILKGYIGLSAAVYTEIYIGVLHNSATRLLLFLTLGLPAICLPMIYLVRQCTPASEEDSSQHRYFRFTLYANIFLALYLLSTTILDDRLSLSNAISYTIFGIMILLMLAPLAIPLKMTLYPTPRKTVIPLDLSDPADQERTEPLLELSASDMNIKSFLDAEEDSNFNILLAEGEGAVKPTKRRPRRGEDFNFGQAIIKADFWLLFLAYLLGVGSGVTVLNNLAQIGIAAGDNDTTVLLSIFSFCNFVGRLSGGFVSERFVKSRMIPRPIWMTVTQLLMIVVYLLFALAFDSALYVSTAVLGICYGVQFSIMIPTASELFGLKDFVKIYNFMLLGNPIGALLFSGILAGYVYDAEAERQHQPGASCSGPDCFRITFLVLAAVCVVGSSLCAVLTWRVWPVYEKLYASGSLRQPQSSH